jgi:hypothetical protein
VHLLADDLSGDSVEMGGESIAQFLHAPSNGRGPCPDQLRPDDAMALRLFSDLCVRHAQERRRTQLCSMRIRRVELLSS